MSSSPIGPQPITAAVPANGRCPRSAEWIATPSGSSMAPSASDTPSGSGMQQARRPGHDLAEHAVGLAVAGEPDPVAQVPVAVPAGPARLVRDRRVDRHPLAAPRPVRDHPRALVAEHQRMREPGVADRALVPPVQVRAADADRGDPHQAHPRPRLRLGLVRHPQVAHRVQSRRAHPFLLSPPSCHFYPERAALSFPAGPAPRRVDKTAKPVIPGGWPGITGVRGGLQGCPPRVSRPRGRRPASRSPSATARSGPPS